MPPNIILTIADDQRFDTIAAHGNRTIHTPHLDRLAEHGTSYRRAQHGGSSHGGVCAPSRAQLHTGRHLWATSDHMTALRRPIDNRRRGNDNRPHVTLGQHLQRAGYDTFAVGKWHIGEGSLLRSFHAGERIMMGGMGPHFCVRASDLPAGSGKLGPAFVKSGHSTDLFAGAAVDFLNRRAVRNERPFFLYVAFTAPHDPRETHWRFRRRYDPKSMKLSPAFAPQHSFDLDCANDRDEMLAEYPRHPDEARMHEADYFAMITHLDEGLGRIHAALAASGLADNTLVVHTADHGLALGRHGLMGKQSLYDHSTRVPLLVAGPGFEAGIDDERLCYQHDLFPTLLERAGVKRVHSDFVDLQGTRRKTVYCAYSRTMRSIRDEQMKLIEYRLSAGRYTQLFDTRADSHEMRNLAATPEYASTVRRLRATLQQNMQSRNDPFNRS